PAPPRVSPLALHDALPIYRPGEGTGEVLPVGVERCDVVRRTGLELRPGLGVGHAAVEAAVELVEAGLVEEGVDLRVAEASRPDPDRKSTRLNSSHVKISYA